MLRDRTGLSAAALILAATIVASPQTSRAQSQPKPWGAAIVAQADSPKLFHGVGKIVAVDAPSGFVTISHEAIPGLMDAMTMQFEAKPATLLDGLKPGEKVEFALDGKTYALLAITRAAAEK